MLMSTSMQRFVLQINTTDHHYIRCWPHVKTFDM